MLGVRVTVSFGTAEMMTLHLHMNVLLQLEIDTNFRESEDCLSRDGIDKQYTVNSGT